MAEATDIFETDMSEAFFWRNWLKERGRSTEPTLSYAVSSMDDMRLVADQISQNLSTGDVIVLSGGLGAGKTSFTGMLALSLGLGDYVNSPTFTLVSEHENQKAAGLSLWHFDCYRLSDSNDFLNSGLDEYFDRPGITVIEWADRIYDLLPDSAVIIEILRKKVDPASEERTVNIYQNFTGKGGGGK